MNKFSKIISVALVLVLALSVMVMPTSAADVAIKARVEAEYQGKTTAGYDYYLFNVYVDSTHSLNAVQCNVSWDSSVWTMIRYGNKNDATAFNALVINRNDTENILYKLTDEYALYGMDGEYGMWEHDDIGEGYAFMAADAAAPTVSGIADNNLGSELKAAGYTGAYMTWSNIFTDSYLNISGGTVNGANAPGSGEVKVMSWYMRLNDGVVPGDYEVGFNAKQNVKLTGAWNTQDAIASKDIGSNMAEITSATNIAYTNAIVTVGGAPELSISQHKDQIRYNADTFDYRTVFKIDNFSEVFADLNDGSDRIIDAGFIFSTEEAIDVAAAKAQVESWKATADGKNITFDVMNYTAATRCYVSNTFAGAEYAFACLVKNIPNSVGEGENANLSALGYIIYEDAEGNPAYAYCDYTLDVDALYKQYK